MEVTIKDGTGSQQEAHVDHQGRVSVFAITEPEDKHVARRGKTWSYTFDVTPVGAGDYFFYFENTGEEIYTFTDVRIMCASPDTINVDAVSGTPTYAAGADISPINRNRGFTSVIPSATCREDTNTTGISSDGTLFFLRLDTANKGYKLSTSSNVHIPKGAAIAFSAATGTALMTCTVSMSILDTE